MFVVFAAAAVAWSLLVIVAVFTRRRRALLAGSAVAVVAAIASIATDVRALQLARGAQASGITIRIVPQDSWWKLEYAQDGTSVVTANELHVPIGTAVTLTWSGLPPPWIGGAVCAPRGDDRCVLVANSADAATFIGIWPPMWRHLPVVAEPPARFEAWLRNEALPARTADAALFTSAGCAYCHVIRGASMAATEVAPDLTHFASRRTIAATRFPNRRGFLAGWIVHSSALKGDSGMPDNRLDPTVLRGVLDYLESLR
ncbi:MAG TPA: c-type cytochrome [Thermoanaerobaculia bacterium]|nr:c-type cytochrome [Thermoanaerobaculia bacterium]